jgi:hypothetical protein
MNNRQIKGVLDGVIVWLDKHDRLLGEALKSNERMQRMLVDEIIKATTMKKEQFDKQDLDRVY